MAGNALFATLALGGMCLLMWWLARLAKKRMGVGAGTVSGDGLRVVGKRPLDARSGAALYVIEIAGGRHIIVGTGSNGTVTKVDDISPDEYAIMSADEDRPARARPRLRVAGASAPHVVTGAVSETAQADDATEEAPAAEGQRFMTVGESFGHFMNKARDARSGRRDRPASGE